MSQRSKNSPIDWLELDRLVDGRLSDGEYRQLLCQIDADPNGWKQCALAFLEHQALERELGAFAADPNCQMLPGLGAMDTFVNESKLPSELVGVQQEGRFQRNSALVGWLSMALCVVAGLALGFTLNSNFKENLGPAAPTMDFALNDVSAPLMGSSEPSDELAASNTNANGQAGENEQGCSITAKKSNCGSKRSCSSQRHRCSLQNRRKNMKQHDSVTSSGLCPVFESLQDSDESQVDSDKE